MSVIHSKQTFISFLAMLLFVLNISIGECSNWDEKAAENALKSGFLLKKSGNYERAEIELKRALDLYLDGGGPDHPRVATCLDNLSKVYAAMEKWDKAIDSKERVLKIDRKLYGENDLYVGLGLKNISIYYYEVSKYKESVSAARGALEVFKQLTGKYGKYRLPLMASGASGLADALSFAGNSAEAEKYYKIAIDAFEKLNKTDKSTFKITLTNYAFHLRKNGKEKEAKIYSDRANKLR